MKYKQLRDFTLQLINQYSVAGVTIAETYNNQSDYLKRIPALLNDAAVQAATTMAPIRATENLANLRCDDNGAWRVYTLPEDCFEVCSSGLIQFDDGDFRRFHRYHPVGRTKIAVPRDLSGEVHVEYFRYPYLLKDEPADEDEPDNTLAVQMALPYYAAAQLVMQDDAFAYSALSNEFESRLSRLAERPHTDMTVVEDAYGV